MAGTDKFAALLQNLVARTLEGIRLACVEAVATAHDWRSVLGQLGLLELPRRISPAVIAQLMEGTSVSGNAKTKAAATLIDEPRLIQIEIEPAEARKAWESFKKRIADRPVQSDGQRFTRDELHERG